MKDTELRSRLLALGMPEDDADDVTRDIRDRLHPVAAIAVARARDHETALGLYAAYGDAGLEGYEVDQLSGLLKSIKKVGKTALKTVGKAASVIAPIMPIAAVVAIGASVVTKGKKGPATASAALQKKQKEQADHTAWMAKNAGGKATKASEVAKQQRLASEVASLQAQVNAEQGISVSEQIATQPYAAVPTGVAQTGTGIARTMIKGNVRPAMVTRAADGGLQIAATNLPPAASETAGLLQTLLAQQGTSLMSPQAQSILSDVATEGVQQTAAGPPSIPKWAVPVGIGAAALGLLLFMRKRK